MKTTFKEVKGTERVIVEGGYREITIDGATWKKWLSAYNPSWHIYRKYPTAYLAVATLSENTILDALWERLQYYKSLERQINIVDDELGWKGTGTGRIGAIKALKDEKELNKRTNLGVINNAFLAKNPLTNQLIWVTPV